MRRFSLHCLLVAALGCTGQPAASPPTADELAFAALDRPVTLDCYSMPLEDVLKEFSWQADVRIDYQPRRVVKYPTAELRLREVPLRMALQMAMDRVPEVDWSIVDGRIVVASHDLLPDAAVETRVYPVAEFLAPLSPDFDFDEQTLADWLMNSTDTSRWVDYGGSHSVVVVPGALVVHGSLDEHRIAERFFRTLARMVHDDNSAEPLSFDNSPQHDKLRSALARNVLLEADAEPLAKVIERLVADLPLGIAIKPWLHEDGKLVTARFEAPLREVLSCLADAAGEFCKLQETTLLIGKELDDDGFPDDVRLYDLRQGLPDLEGSFFSENVLDSFVDVGAWGDWGGPSPCEDYGWAALVPFYADGHYDAQRALLAFTRLHDARRPTVPLVQDHDPLVQALRRRVSVDWHEARLGEVLPHLLNEHGVPYLLVDWPEPDDEAVSLSVRDLPLHNLLGLISSLHGPSDRRLYLGGYRWRYDGQEGVHAPLIRPYRLLGPRWHGPDGHEDQPRERLANYLRQVTGRSEPGMVVEAVPSGLLVAGDLATHLEVEALIAAYETMLESSAEAVRVGCTPEEEWVLTALDRPLDLAATPGGTAGSPSQNTELLGILVESLAEASALEGRVVVDWQDLSPTVECPVPRPGMTLREALDACLPPEAEYQLRHGVLYLDAGLAPRFPLETWLYRAPKSRSESGGTAWFLRYIEYAYPNAQAQDVYDDGHLVAVRATAADHRRIAVEFRHP